MQVSTYALLITLGLLPSVIWLAYWIRKDAHPEPKIFIVKVLLLGIILSPLAVAGQLLFVQFVAQLTGANPAVLAESPSFFLWAAFVEEVVKYLVVFFVVLRSPEFDEPVDAMVYMLSAAMGFAAMENILVINRVMEAGLAATVGIWGLRFAGATLLHALSSALLGYFIALTWFHPKRRTVLFAIGLGMATLFHWVFNLFISQFQQSSGLLFSTLLLIAMAFLISTLFDKISKRDAHALHS